MDIADTQIISVDIPTIQRTGADFKWNAKLGTNVDLSMKNKCHPSPVIIKKTAKLYTAHLNTSTEIKAVF